MRALLIAAPVWCAFALIGGLYLYYAGRVTRRLREFHAEAWERLSWLPGWGWPRRVRKYSEPNPTRGLSAILWYGRPHLKDPELDRLAGITRIYAVLTVLALTASILVFALFPDADFRVNSIHPVPGHFP